MEKRDEKLLDEQISVALRDERPEDIRLLSELLGISEEDIRNLVNFPETRQARETLKKIRIARDKIVFGFKDEDVKQDLSTYGNDVLVQLTDGEGRSGTIRYSDHSDYDIVYRDLGYRPETIIREHIHNHKDGSIYYRKSKIDIEEGEVVLEENGKTPFYPTQDVAVLDLMKTAVRETIGNTKEAEEALQTPAKQELSQENEGEEYGDN